MHGTILIIERDPDLRTALSDVLSLAGLKPITAVSREEITTLLTQNPDPVNFTLLGIHHPQDTTNELVQQLSQLQPGMKLILTSGYREDVVLSSVESKPSVSFLRKPYTSRRLLRHLQELSA